MVTLDLFITRFDEPEILENGVKKYTGYTFSEYINPPDGFYDVEDMCEYPYKVTWTCSDPFAFLEYCEHDITLYIFENEEDFVKLFSDEVWRYVIPGRLLKAKEIFQVRINDKKESYHVVRTLSDPLFKKLSSIEVNKGDMLEGDTLQANEFNWWWADQIICLFCEKYCNEQDLPELRENPDLLQDWIYGINIPDVVYLSEHLEWLQLRNSIWYINEVLERGTCSQSFYGLCDEAEAIEQNIIRDIVKEFLHWLIFEYEENQVWEITNSNIHNVSSFVAI
jgi:hypothetical protein